MCWAAYLVDRACDRVDHLSAHTTTIDQWQQDAQRECKEKRGTHCERRREDEREQKRVWKGRVMGQYCCVHVLVLYEKAA